jgi:hypothetical protein
MTIKRLTLIGAKVVSHGRYVAFQDGRGRHPTADVPRDFAADCGTTAAATTSARFGGDSHGAESRVDWVSAAADDVADSF